MSLKKVVKGIPIIMFMILLVSCSANTNTTKDTQKNSTKVSKEVTDEKQATEETPSTLEIFNLMAENSKTVDEVYVTGDLTVGPEGDVSPGIYDLEITGGNGNISGKRNYVPQLFINWIGSSIDSGSDGPSKIRIILFEGDTLSFREISKVKFTAIPKDVELSNELGIGEYIVGRDIAAGKYKLSTNAQMNPEFSNLGWSLTIYNDPDRKSREQTLNAGNEDVAVELSDGEVISTNFFNTNHDAKTDDAKLIFSALE